MEGDSRCSFGPVVYFVDCDKVINGDSFITLISMAFFFVSIYELYGFSLNIHVIVMVNYVITDSPYSVSELFFCSSSFICLH